MLKGLKSNWDYDYKRELIVVQLIKFLKPFPKPLSIGSSAFAGRSKLEQIELPKGAKYEGAFDYNTNVITKDK